MTERHLTGEIGNFAGVPIFTDCVLPKSQMLIGPNISDLLGQNRGLEHTCEPGKRCSRWHLEAKDL